MIFVNSYSITHRSTSIPLVRKCEFCWVQMEREYELIATCAQAPRPVLPAVLPLSSPSIQPSSPHRDQILGQKIGFCAWMKSPCTSQVRSLYTHQCIPRLLNRQLVNSSVDADLGGSPSRPESMPKFTMWRYMYFGLKYFYGFVGTGRRSTGTIAEISCRLALFMKRIGHLVRAPNWRLHATCCMHDCIATCHVLYYTPWTAVPNKSVKWGLWWCDKVVGI